MPQLGEIIPDGAMTFFPDGTYGAALLATMVRAALCKVRFFKFRHMRTLPHTLTISAITTAGIFGTTTVTMRNLPRQTSKVQRSLYATS